MIFIQTTELVESAKSLLSIEYVSVVGLLLCFCAYLIIVNKKVTKDNKEKDIAILGFIEKYYVISTEVKEVNKNLTKELDRIVEELKRR